ncbi:MAG: DUF4198 domain-containing protein [Pedobacter sp.]|nr:MAG: DUF4198 domain-containing protein [Pedobacter sp.]
MKNIKIIIAALILCLTYSGAFAHALWIETSSSGKSGQKHTVKVFYGEFVTGERDSVAKWYSDVKDFSLWLVGPNHEKVQLNLTPGTNYLESSFVPDQDGGYTLLVSHEAKELGGATKYHFLSSATVSVGKTLPEIGDNTNALTVYTEDLLSAKKNKPLQLKALLKGAPAAGKAITVFSSNGWSKELLTDSNGSARFTPLWPGQYVVEVSDTDKTPGQHYGKDFKATWKGATYSFEIK